jgi:hypothetical protein
VAVDALIEIEIKRLREEVSAFAANPSNTTAWYKNTKAVEWETPPPAVVGSRIRFRAQFLGRILDYTYEVQELDPGCRFVMATAQWPFPMETTYSWEDSPGGATKMTLRNRGEPSGFAAVAAPVMARPRSSSRSRPALRPMSSGKRACGGGRPAPRYRQGQPSSTAYALGAQRGPSAREVAAVHPDRRRLLQALTARR